MQSALWAGTTGSISGTVADPTGAVISGGAVTAVSSSQGVQHTTATDPSGVYTSPSLSVGDYTVRVDAKGFKPLRRGGLTVNIDSAVVVNLTLEMAEMRDEVTVSSGDVGIETVGTQMGSVVGGNTMTAVALNGRSYTDLMALQPGIVPVSTQQPDSIVMAGVGVAIAPSGGLNPGNQSISGQREDANGFMVNGSDVKELMNGGTSIIPNLDSIAEFRILTNNFDGEYGN